MRIFLAVLVSATPAAAQTAADPSGFGGFAQADEQVNISADALEIAEDENTALFTGDVVIIQARWKCAPPGAGGLWRGRAERS